MPRLVRLYEKKRGDRRTGSSKLGSVGEALFFGTFFVVGAIALAVMLVSFVWPEWRVNRHFIESECTVKAKRIHQKPNNSGGTAYRAEFDLAYPVDGREQKATTLDIGRDYSTNRARAERTLARFKVDEKYPCWYDPLNPDQVVIERGYSTWFYLFLLVPISFIAIGGGGLAFTWLHWGTSAEQRSAMTQRATNIDLLDDPADERRAYPTVPADTDLKNSPGTKLAYRLPVGTAPGWALFAAFAACLFWNGITSVFVIIAIRSHMNGNPEWFLTFFILPFVAIGGVLIFAVVRQLLITTGIGPTRVEISHHPLHPGQACELYIVQEGRLSMNSFEVLLACDEHATYRQGTDTRTDEKRVFEQQVFRRDDFQIDRSAPYETACPLSIPAAAMHSFKSDHNELRWKLIVKGDVAGWPNFDRAYSVVVFPAGHEEDAT